MMTLLYQSVPDDDHPKHGPRPRPRVLESPVPISRFFLAKVIGPPQKY